MRECGRALEDREMAQVEFKKWNRIINMVSNDQLRFDHSIPVNKL
jgi:hypothetical protein